MVQSALKAAEKLSAEGKEVAVVDVCAIKPCNEEQIAELLAKYDVVFTAEEHNVIGGLGGLICEIAQISALRRFIVLVSKILMLSLAMPIS